MPPSIVLIDSWFPVHVPAEQTSIAGLGLVDAYPFVWSRTATDKLRFVHEVVRNARATRAR